MYNKCIFKDPQTFIYATDNFVKIMTQNVQEDCNKTYYTILIQFHHYSHYFHRDHCVPFKSRIYIACTYLMDVFIHIASYSTM